MFTWKKKRKKSKTIEMTYHQFNNSMTVHAANIHQVGQWFEWSNHLHFPFKMWRKLYDSDYLSTGVIV